MTVNQFLLFFSLFIYSHNIVKYKTFNLFRFDYSDWFFAIYTTIELVYEWNESLRLKKQMESNKNLINFSNCKHLTDFLD